MDCLTYLDEKASISEEGLKASWVMAVRICGSVWSSWEGRVGGNRACKYPNGIDLAGQTPIRRFGPPPRALTQECAGAPSQHGGRLVQADRARVGAGRQHLARRSNGQPGAPDATRIAPGVDATPAGHVPHLNQARPARGEEEASVGGEGGALAAAEARVGLRRVQGPDELLRFCGEQQQGARLGDHAESGSVGGGQQLAEAGLLAADDAGEHYRPAGVQVEGRPLPAPAARQHVRPVGTEDSREHWHPRQVHRLHQGVALPVDAEEADRLIQASGERELGVGMPAHAADGRRARRGRVQIGGPLDGELRRREGRRRRE
eukprot:scaffold18423_cov110-Isochrysis_galbana.AAC.2